MNPTTRSGWPLSVIVKYWVVGIPLAKTAEYFGIQFDLEIVALAHNSVTARLAIEAAVQSLS
ncbi:hypothetical protein CJ178_20520 [Rhodococcus sp. ACPA4]|uniref:hypothetical protein n=1 Tax=Rhodococcus TaxID=1827 RepID=UPI00052419FB|nr:MULTISPECIES: hypothetical protein [Rhodococcus]NMD63079.1 hypothetical protein [Nocardia globerula]NRI69746.1 hypothetical protein [Rhodococcus sp. MS16]PBC43670.1 hypothetical protein CJ178_20520 [Rhodococcus sp. ACPA4]